MAGKPYTKQETDLMHKRIEEKLDVIIGQTTKHNARLTKLERFVWTLSGGMIIFSMLEFERIIDLFM